MIARRIFGLLILAGALSANADPPAKGKAPPERKLTVDGKSVRLPGAWLTCQQDSDCAWVRASCEDVETGVNAQHAAEARAKLNKPCEGTNRGMLALLQQKPPACANGVCAEHAGNVFGPLFDSAPADGGSGSRP